MRSIEGKMRSGIKRSAARCSICKDHIPPGIRVRAVIEQVRGQDGQPDIAFAHPACLARYLRNNPDLMDHRDAPGALPDAKVRRFWLDLERRKGWAKALDQVLPV